MPNRENAVRYRNGLIFGRQLPSFQLLLPNREPGCGLLDQAGMTLRVSLAEYERVLATVTIRRLPFERLFETFASAHQGHRNEKDGVGRSRTRSRASFRHLC